MHRFARLFLVIGLLSGPAWSQATQPDSSKPGSTADEAELYAQMHELQSQFGEGKRDFVAQQLTLTPEQATKFWPVYDAHQKALAALNQRRLDNIVVYARHWNANSLDDATATKLGKDALDIERDEAALMQTTFDKLRKVVPVVQAVRYLQVENKVRAIVRFEQAAQVPLAP